MHPWEIDPDPPRIDLPWSKSFAHYFRLGGFRVGSSASCAVRSSRPRQTWNCPRCLMAPVRLRLCCLLVLLVPSVGRAADVTLRGIAIDRAVDAPLVEATRGIAPIVRINVDNVSEIAPARLEAIVNAYQARRMRVIVAFGALPPGGADVEVWRQLLRTTAERCRGKVAAYQIGSVAADRTPDAARYAYDLKLAAVQLHAADDAALVLQGLLPPTAVAWQRDVLAAGVASYIDGVALGGPESADRDAYRASVRQMSAMIAREKPSATIVVGPIRVPAAAAEAAGVVVDAALRSLADGTHVTAFDGDTVAIRSALNGSAPAMELLTRDRHARRACLRRAPATGRSGRDRRRPAPAAVRVRGRNVSSIGPRRRSISGDGAQRADAEGPRPADGRVPRSIRIARRNDALSLTLPGAAHAHPRLQFRQREQPEPTSTCRSDALPRRGDRRAASAGAGGADRGDRSFIAHVRIGSTSSDAGRSGLQRRDREPPVLGSFRHRVGGAELRDERRKWTTNRPSFPLVQPEGPVASARPAAQPGLHAARRRRHD